jgi:hypothetical protein
LYFVYFEGFGRAALDQTGAFNTEYAEFTEKEQRDVDGHRSPFYRSYSKPTSALMLRSPRDLG